MIGKFFSQSPSTLREFLTQSNFQGAPRFPVLVRAYVIVENLQISLSAAEERVMHTVVEVLGTS